MSFQWVVDRAETLSIRRKKMVATTTARDGIVRAISRGLLPETIEIRVADGIPWDLMRANIAAAEALDKLTTSTITIPYEGFEWFYNYVEPATPTTWTVRCIEFPQWTIFARNQVSWSGPFVFQEVSGG